MKWSIFSLIIFFSNTTFGQNLRDIFLSLPDSCVGLNKSQRDSLIQNFIGGKNNVENGVGISNCYLTVYEIKSGYLLFTGAYEGSTTMTFWNISTGDKLIGIVNESCGGACDNNIGFLLRRNKVYKRMDLNDVLPKLSFDDFMDTVKMRKNKVDIEREKSKFESSDLLYHLPKKGKNIIVESQYQEMDMEDNLKVYSLGAKIELVWSDGKFIKGSHVE